MEGKIQDARYPTAQWAKMSYTRTLQDGTKTEIHFWQNRNTGTTEGFEFKNATPVTR